MQVESDHKPLETILKKPLAEAPKRLQRMMLELQRYDFEVHYRKGVELYVADTLSRAPSDKGATSDEELRLEFEQVSAIEDTEVSDERLKELMEYTANDDVLQKVVQYILKGWPVSKTDVPKEIQPYFHCRDELVTEQGIVFKGSRCIIPMALCPTILQRIHAGHPEIVGSC